MTKQELCVALYSPLFAERDDTKKAYEEMMYHLKGNTEAVVAVHVFMNTLAKAFEAAE